MEIILGLTIVGVIAVGGEVAMRFWLKKRGYEERIAQLTEALETPPQLPAKQGPYRGLNPEALKLTKASDSDDFFDPDREKRMMERRAKLSDQGAMIALIQALESKSVNDPDIQWLARSIPLEVILKRPSSVQARCEFGFPSPQLPWVEDGVAKALIARALPEDAAKIFVWSLHRDTEDFPLAAVRAVTAVPDQDRCEVVSVLYKMRQSYCGKAHRLADQAYQKIDSEVRADALIEALEEGLIEQDEVSRALSQTEIGRRKWTSYCFGGMAYARYKSGKII